MALQADWWTLVFHRIDESPLEAFEPHPPLLRVLGKRSISLLCKLPLDSSGGTCSLGVLATSKAGDDADRDCVRLMPSKGSWGGGGVEECKAAAKEFNVGRCRVLGTISERQGKVTLTGAASSILVENKGNRSNESSAPSARLL